MSNNKFEGLLPRVITAFLGISFIAILYYFLETNGLYLFSTIASLMIGYEAGKMSFTKKNSLIPLLVINGAWFIYYFFNPNISHLFGAIIISLTSWVWLSRIRNLNKEEIFSERSNVPSFILFSLVCPTFVLAHLTLDGGLGKFIYLLAAIFMFDTLSFFFGKTFGGKVFKTPLYPSASPTKTIEGALFAAISCSLIVWFTEPFFMSESPFVNFDNYLKAFLILSYYLLALTGDLVESLLKRSAGAKDSGSFLPGHGGFFDRLDGVLFASILSFLLLQ